MKAAQKKIVETRKRLLSRITSAKSALKKLQAGCKHPAVAVKYGSNTGNYDPTADCYWTDYFCPDCWKNWTIFK